MVAHDMSHISSRLSPHTGHGARWPLETVMNQATLSFAAPTTLPADPADRVGSDIGWDHAHHGLVPPAELLHQGTPVTQGWMVGKAVFGRRTLATARSTRQWLALRLLAWRRGIHFEIEQVTANHLAQLHTDRCPVTRRTLGGAAGQADAAGVDRLNPQAGYAAGNLVTLSHAASQAWLGVNVMQAMRQARAQEAGAPDKAGLDASAWWRLAALRSYATPLPFHEAAQVPLAVLPPNRVRMLNAVQGLQALVTNLFMTPGWSARCRALGALLPAHTSRHDFNLFVGALAPRVLEAGAEPRALRMALEDAWLHERVQRRWQHLVLCLGEAATKDLLERAIAAGLAVRRTVNHAPDQAVAGWALERGGRSALVEGHYHPVGQGVGLAGEDESSIQIGLFERKVAVHAHLALQ